MREFGVDANVGKPQVAYRETIRNKVEKVEGRFVRQSGGRGQYGHVVIEMRAQRARAAATSSRAASSGGSIPREYIPSVDDGIQEAMSSGVLAGYPMVDIKVALIDGQLPRGRLLGHGVQDRRLAGVQERRPEGQARCCSSR